jgi:UDP-2-acetamido-2,6-beta-L-arabino-hexul-4-ose reductase
MSTRSVLVTGAAGFIGRNLLDVLRRRTDLLVTGVDADAAPEVLDGALAGCDAIVHLAGVNRPDDAAEFETGNAGFTRALCARLATAGRRPLLIFASSTQAERDNPYGRSKLGAEEALEDWSRQTGAPVVIFRLPNVFGKWGRPEYNSVAATFCHHIAHDLPIRVDDPASPLDLVYVGDVVTEFLGTLDDPAPAGCTRRVPEHVASTTVGDLAERIRGFRALDGAIDLPDLGDRFTRQLYATYLSYAPAGAHVFPLELRTDERGSLAELLRQPHCGQVFFSRTRPGVVRGNHYHDTKIERFMVVEGSATIRLRTSGGTEVTVRTVSGERPEVVVIPPGVVHCIENRGERDLLTLFWADEVFDPERPDTYAEPVLLEEERP